MMGIEMCEKQRKIVPWIDEDVETDPSTPWIKIGLKKDAPEDVKIAYKIYMEYNKKCWIMGIH